METIWFCIVAFMIAMYVLLDGFDLGAGAIHLWVAKTDEERRQVLASIGPVWDGNEVWLVAGGGTLYFAFPALYASGFSGFYLPLMIVLWLLVLRGISIEFRNHIDSPVTARLAGTWCEAFLSMRPATSSSLCGPISGLDRLRASSIGTPFWWDWPRTSL